MSGQGERISAAVLAERFTGPLHGRMTVSGGTRFQCACCGYYPFTRLPESGVDRCPICGWTVDIVMQTWHVPGAMASNRVDLVQAQQNYAMHGVTEPIRRHRDPLPEEGPPEPPYIVPLSDRDDGQ